MKLLDFGKYRGIIVSIALFLLLDASVLLMNFYISFQIADDAEGVNIAGRQRMLSQRTMKSLLDLRVSSEDSQQVSRALQELSTTTQLFDSTLSAFRDGGIVKGASNAPVDLPPVTSADSLAALAEADTIWQPYYQKVKAVLKWDGDVETALDDAIDYGQQHNLSLLALMNRLTVDLEGVASSKATRLRWIQTVGITLAIINFFLIMFHFLRQLRDSDEKIAAAQQETQEILDTVNEGLFLLDEKMRVGSQHSSELETILGQKDLAGRTLDYLLKDMLSSKDLQNMRNFISLLFNPRKKQKLLGDLNPLKQVEVLVGGDDVAAQRKYLRFTFSRVLEGNKILHILVTVRDVTAQVELSKALEDAKQQGHQQLEMLSSILQINKKLFSLFIDNCYKSFNKINDILKEPGSDSAYLLTKANDIYRIMHNVKGEASALNLTRYVDFAHEFEDRVEGIRKQKRLTGEHFIGLTLQLEEMLQYTDTIAAFADRLGVASETDNSQSAVTDDKGLQWDHLYDLSAQVAERQGKEVELLISGLGEQVLSDDFVQVLNGISVQLIRNSVTHGIESKQGRLGAEKPECGLMNIRFTRRRNGDYLYTFDDDGKGFDIEAIRGTAVAKGVISEQQAELMDSKQIISLAFSPELSTRDGSDVDAGRGVGMSAVKAMVDELSAKLQVYSRAGRGSSFTIAFPSTCNAIKNAAA